MGDRQRASIRRERHPVICAVTATKSAFAYAEQSAPVRKLASENVPVPAGTWIPPYSVGADRTHMEIDLPGNPVGWSLRRLQMHPPVVR
jgi:hypothetical protein